MNLCRGTCHGVCHLPMLYITATRVDTMTHVQGIQERQFDCMYLDVGGMPFHTSKEVLKNDGEHLLSVIAEDHFASESDDRGYVFLDRDGHCFSTILSYLRCALLCMRVCPPLGTLSRALV